MPLVASKKALGDLACPGPRALWLNRPAMTMSAFEIIPQQSSADPVASLLLPV